MDNSMIDPDKELQGMILTDLLNDPRLSSQSVKVNVEQGIVTLTGTVHSYRRKLAAHEMAACYDGVRDVVNNLIVEPDQPTTDEQVAARVRNALDASADVTKEAISVKVVGGTVTLEGNCGSQWERVVAEDVTRSVRGVKDVNNLLLVNLVEKIGDEELSYAIQAALSRTRGLREAGVNIAIVDSAAVLSGEVDTLEQKVAAERTVSRFGLLHIRNEIFVKSP